MWNWLRKSMIIATIENKFPYWRLAGLNSIEKAFFAMGACAWCVCLVKWFWKCTVMDFPISFSQWDAFPFPCLRLPISNPVSAVLIGTFSAFLKCYLVVRRDWLPQQCKIDCHMFLQWWSKWVWTPFSTVRLKASVKVSIHFSNNLKP